MKILILGGTVFLGRHIAAAALVRGHAVALLNRGRTFPDLFPEAEKLRGDRDGDLSALRGRNFDAVIDCSGYRPEQLRAVLEALDGGIGHYIFLSSISAYQGFPPGRTYDEDAALAQGSAGYGALKARCEEALVAALPERSACVRPGLIAGPYDPTDRFTYWLRRIAQGGHVLAPGRPGRSVQFIDARDLADWCLLLAASKTVGSFNAVGPEAPLTMEEFLNSCRKSVGAELRLSWMSDEYLIAAGVEGWTEMPLWVAENDLESGGVMLGDHRKAAAAGLTFRPVADTIRATLDWHNREGGAPDGPLRVSPLSGQREAALLASLGA